MSGDIDKMVDEMAEEASESVTSPVSGLSEALGAGASLLSTATHWRAMRLRRGVKIELPAYLGVQCSWFMAFGLQMVLFPYLITGRDHLHMDGLALGLANMALSLPSVIFLLIGGVVAERADGKRLLILLHLLAAAPAMLLAFYVGPGELTYPMMIFYAVSIGTIETQFDCTPQSPQPSQMSVLMNTRLSGSGNLPRLRRRRFSAAQVCT